jgi:hypothetical protein
MSRNEGTETERKNTNLETETEMSSDRNTAGMKELEEGTER